MRATYRETPTSPAVECEIINERDNGRYVCRQVGRRLAGVWTARPDQIAPPVELDMEDFGFWVRRNLQAMGAI